MIARLGPDYTLFAVFATALVVAAVIHPVRFRWRNYLVEFSAAAIAAVIGLRFFGRIKDISLGRTHARTELRLAVSSTLRDWGSFFLLTLVFANLESYTTFFRDRTIDDFLYKLDLVAFGVEPTAWLSKLNNPLLTDWMAIAYTSYIVTPLLLSSIVLLRGNRAEFQEMSTAVVLQLYIGFFLCLLFPAGPPRYYLPLVRGVFDPPKLQSFFGLYDVQQLSFDKADPLMTRSAFPSLHCSLALFTLVYTWRFGHFVFPRFKKLFFILCVPLVISLWISTIYLRHHWILDIVVGLALGALSCFLAPRLRRAWPKTIQEVDQVSLAA